MEDVERERSKMGDGERETVIQTYKLQLGSEHPVTQTVRDRNAEKPS